MDRYGLICRCILENPDISQRNLAKELDVSLGTINRLVKECADKGYIEVDTKGSYHLLEGGRRLLEHYRVDGALILAAGFGSRFVPLTFEMPKGLLEVFGERMIERQIRQLHEAGVTDITIVVGYLKEKFEYLIDKYQVKLLYNPEYSCKNTLATVYHAKKLLEGRNMYVLSSDNWMRHNMFHAFECGAWYASVYKSGDTSEWCLKTNKKGKITDVKVGGRDSSVMYGPTFFSKEFSARFLPILESYYHRPGTEQFYWEHVLLDMITNQIDKQTADKSNFSPERSKAHPEDRNVEITRGLGEAPSRTDSQTNNSAERRTDGQTCNGTDGGTDGLTCSGTDGGTDGCMYINRQPEDQIYEFENLEELRAFDPKYQNRSDNEALELVSRVFEIPESEIREIRCLKAGMTNKSFLFCAKGRHYICRIPGPGTALLINRKEEKAVYDVAASLNITERVIYFDGETGYKISDYYEGARNADAKNPDDMKQCMEVLRRLHKSALKVDHSFSVRERISFYEKLCRSQGGPLFEDYGEVKAQMEWILDELEKLGRPVTLSHIDSVKDNFLFLPSGEVKLIDWEYSGMCDPLIDIAMCCIYSYYNREEADHLLEMYLERKPTGEETWVTYAYMALGGFLWSLWAVYKSALGEEFGEYTLIMYRYAKEFYRKLIHKL